MSFTLDREQYAEGQAVKMAMTVRNDSKAACSMVVPDSGGAFQILIFRGDQQVWDSMSCWMYFDVVTYETWSSGKTKTVRFTWNQHENDTSRHGDQCRESGPAVGSGDYTAVGVFRHYGKLRRSVAFRIGSPGPLPTGIRS